MKASLRRSAHSIVLREPDPETQSIDLAASAGPTRTGLTGTAGTSAEDSQHAAGDALVSAKTGLAMTGRVRSVTAGRGSPASLLGSCEV